MTAVNSGGIERGRGRWPMLVPTGRSCETLFSFRGRQIRSHPRPEDLHPTGVAQWPSHICRQVLHACQHVMECLCRGGRRGGGGCQRVSGYISAASGSLSGTWSGWGLNPVASRQPHRCWRHNKRPQCQQAPHTDLPLDWQLLKGHAVHACSAHVSSQPCTVGYFENGNPLESAVSPLFIASCENAKL